jgi:hypothetical protein
MGIAAVIALCAAPVMAGSQRHGGSGGGGGGGDEGGTTFFKSEPSTDKKWFEDSDGKGSDVPMAAVPEPGAGLVFAAGALVIASRLRRKRS